MILNYVWNKNLPYKLPNNHKSNVRQMKKNELLNKGQIYSVVRKSKGIFFCPKFVKTIYNHLPMQLIETLQSIQYNIWSMSQQTQQKILHS